MRKLIFSVFCVLPLCASAEEVPAMFSCLDIEDNRNGMFMVAIGEKTSAPFMLFDRTGRFVNRGVFSVGRTDAGKIEYHADVNKVHLVFSLMSEKDSPEERWTLTLINNNKKNQVLECM